MSRIILIVVAFATLLLAVPLAQAAIPYAHETPLAVGPGAQQAPQFGHDGYYSGERVWEDDGSGDWNVLFLSDLTPAVLPGGTSGQRHPAVWDWWVVYEDDSAGNPDICAFDRRQLLPPSPAPTPTASPLTTSTADQLDPAIDGTKVVYEDNSRGDWDISTFDLATGASSRLTASRADQVDPAIDGNGVVYADHRNGNWDVYYFDLKTRRERRLTTSRADQTAPQIDRGVVFYQDHRNGNWDIYSFTLKTGRERRLTTDPHNQTAPQINRSTDVKRAVVVYEDDRNGASDIYCYDALGGVNKQLTDDPAAQTTPSIDDEVVLWCDARSGDPDVYSAWLDYPELGLAGPGGTPRYNATVTVTGTLHVPVGSANLEKVLVSGAGKTRSVAVADVGDTGYGTYSLSVRNVVRKITLRALYNGGAANLSTSSWWPVTIKPRALLSRPAATGVKKPIAPGTIGVSMDNPTQWVISGTLKPRHRAGAQAVTLKCYKYSLSGMYFGYYLKKTVRVRVSNVGAYSGYRTTLKLADGKWKIVAVHADGDHAETVSAASKILNSGRFWVN